MHTPNPHMRKDDRHLCQESDLLMTYQMLIHSERSPALMTNPHFSSGPSHTQHSSREDDRHLCQESDLLMTHQMLIHSERRPCP